MKLTFLDTGVLIAAARGHTEQSARALEILDDPGREFAGSRFLRLELVPRAVHNKRETEVAFYEAFFSEVKHWATDLEALVEAAHREASSYGVEAMDALHVAAAAAVGADELVTTEKPSRSIHPAQSVKVVTIHSEGR